MPSRSRASRPTRRGAYSSARPPDLGVGVRPAVPTRPVLVCSRTQIHSAPSFRLPEPPPMCRSWRKVTASMRVMVSGPRRGGRGGRRRGSSKPQGRRGPSGLFHQSPARNPVHRLASNVIIVRKCTDDRDRKQQMVARSNGAAQCGGERRLLSCEGPPAHHLSSDAGARLSTRSCSLSPAIWRANSVGPRYPAHDLSAALPRDSP